MSQGRVGAVIVNFNGGNDLLHCVESLHDDGVEDVVVTDNGSTDSSIGHLATRFPEIPVLHLPNPGYGAGANHAARKLDNEVVFILNPDASLRPGTVSTLLAHLDSDPSIGIAGPRIEDPSGTLYPSARQFPSFVDGVGHALFGMFKPDNRWTRRYKMLDWGHTSLREVDWVSGAAMFVRREAFDSVGGFDEDYWMYMEDVDLCWRIRRAGWKVVFEPTAVVVHIGGTATTNSPRPFRFVLAHHRSVIRYHRKTGRGLERVLLPLIVVGMGLRLPLVWLRTRSAARSGAPLVQKPE